MRELNTRELPENLAEIFSLTSTAHLTKKNEKKYSSESEWRELYHRAKKEGDIEAGFKVVTKLMESKQKELKAFRESLQGEKVTLVPVLSETNSKNVLPAAFALALEDFLDAKICYDVEKKSTQTLTDSKLVDRIPSELEFKGRPASTEGKFIVIDDNYTTGKTILSVMSHLQKNDCEVHSVMTLASSRYSKRLKPTDEQIERVQLELNLTNKEITGICGHGIEKFTGAELQAIILMRSGDKQQWFRDTYSRPISQSSRGNETSDAGGIERPDQKHERSGQPMSLRERAEKRINPPESKGLRRRF
jgi:predicted amidophosphoribosyltransferase